MTRRWTHRAAWSGWLISLLLHALAAGAIFILFRGTRQPAMQWESPIDTRWNGHEVEVVMLDEAPTKLQPTQELPSPAPTLPAEMRIDPPAVQSPPRVEIQPEPPHSPVPLPPSLIETAKPLSPVAVKPSQPSYPTQANVPDWLVRPVVGQNTTPADAPATGATASSAGPRTGPSPNQLPVSAVATTVVYVLDRSASMAIDNRFSVAIDQVMASIRQLSPMSQFQVVVYNRLSETVAIRGNEDWRSPTETTLAELEQALRRMAPEGGNDHLPALKRAIAMRPAEICLLTDADDMSIDQVRLIGNINRGQSAIHCVTLGSAPRQAMQILAANNRGKCKQIQK